MPCRTFSFLLLSAVLQVAVSPAGMAGGFAENNGGGVMVCKRDQDNTERVIMLDLWEAQTLQGLAMKSFDGHPTPDEVLAVAEKSLLRIKLINRAIYAEAVLQLHRIDLMIRSGRPALPAGVEIAPPLDGGNGFVGKNCVMKGVALYDNVTDGLYLDRELYERMSLTDRAALLVHEAVYKVFRDWYDAPNSLGARRFVGCLFSQNFCGTQLSPFSQAGRRLPLVFECVSSRLAFDNRHPEYKFFAGHDPESSDVTLQMTGLRGHPASALTTFNFKSPWLALHPSRSITFDGNSYFQLQTSPRFAERTVFFAAPAGQSMTARFGTNPDMDSSTGDRFDIFIDGSPIYCRRFVSF